MLGNSDVLSYCRWLGALDRKLSSLFEVHLSKCVWLDKFLFLRSMLMNNINSSMLLLLGFFSLLWLLVDILSDFICSHGISTLVSGMVVGLLLDLS